MLVLTVVFWLFVCRLQVERKDERERGGGWRERERKRTRERGFSSYKDVTTIIKACPLDLA